MPLMPRILLATALVVVGLGASPDVWAQPSAPPHAESTQRSPYRWFILVGFVAGGLITAWRIKQARRK